MSQDISDSSVCLRTSPTLNLSWVLVRASCRCRHTSFTGAGHGLFDDESALVVEDQQVGVGLSEIDEVAGQCPAHMEPDLAGDDRSVVAETDADHANPVRRSWGRPRYRAGRLNGRSRVPCLRRGDASRQRLVRALSVIDPIELIDLGLQLLERVSEGLFVEPADRV
jgi:hypothetical protein